MKVSPVEVALDLLHPAAGQGVCAGVGDRHLPAGLEVGAVEPHGVGLAEPDREVVVPGLVVEEVVLDHLAPVPDARPRTR